MEIELREEKEKLAKVNRIIGQYTLNKPGPTLVFFCSIHGNEPSGILAFHRFLDKIKEDNISITGSVIALAGNLAALKLGKRFIHEDLNRIWTNENIEAFLKGSSLNGSAEKAEQRALLEQIHTLVKESKGPLYFVDLHTTSSESRPFITINDTIRNRDFAIQYPLPIVLGIEEHLYGTTLDYINELGHVAIGIEAGQHDTASSVEYHEASIWLTLISAGCAAEEDIELAHKYREKLACTTFGEQHVYEIIYRHHVDDPESFEMNKGYVNFQKVQKRENLAIHNGKEIRSPENGKIFMPLYQKQGNDGFFVIREVRWFWLKLSSRVRSLHLHRYAHWFPGVKRDENKENVLVVNTRIARWLSLSLFHLMGFRKREIRGHHIVFVKREFDTTAPPHHQPKG